MGATVLHLQIQYAAVNGESGKTRGMNDWHAIVATRIAATSLAWLRRNVLQVCRLRDFRYP
jgi:hypothetical protein